MQEKKVRSGEIDLLRFVFSMVILLFHFDGTFHYSRWTHGYIGVEFFFVVSGFLMAKSAFRQSRNMSSLEDIADSTWKFTIRKISGFYRYYICAILIFLIVGYIFMWRNGAAKIIRLILRSIPTLSLTYIEFSNNATSLYIPSSWYLSAMLVASFILYPILIKQYHFSTKIIMPLIALFVLGYLYKTYGSIAVWEQWNGFCYVGLLRATGELALGASLAPLSEWITARDESILNSRNFLARLFVTLIKIGCYAAVLAFAYGVNVGDLFTLHALLFCAIGVLLSFSNAGFFVPDNAFTRYLGKISLPIYIFHGLMRHLMKYSPVKLPLTQENAVFVICGVVLISVALMYLTDSVCFLMQNKKKHWKGA